MTKNNALSIASPPLSLKDKATNFYLALTRYLCYSIILFSCNFFFKKKRVCRFNRNSVNDLFAHPIYLICTAIRSVTPTTSLWTDINTVYSSIQN